MDFTNKLNLELTENHQLAFKIALDKLGATIEALEIPSTKRVFSKMSFSCSGCEYLIDLLYKKGIKNVILCGIETHICIQQTNF